MIYLLSSQKRRQWLIFDAESPVWPGKWGKNADIWFKNAAICRIFWLY